MFLSDRDIILLGATGRRSQTWVMDPDGSDQTRLTFNELSDAAPAFSPDGSRMAFHRGCDCTHGKRHQKEHIPDEPRWLR